MRIHHLNAVCSCPLGGALLDGGPLGRLRGRLACHCLLLEARDQLVLVDTGYGLGDVVRPAERLGLAALALLGPELRSEMTAYRQIERLGLDPHDVRQVVLTHLDLDHAGGLDDFPWATVHLLARELATAQARRSPLDRLRYRPAQWSGLACWQAYTPGEGEPWLGFDCVRGLEGLSDEVLLVPLYGHTLGHAGVAVRRGEGWLLLAGDAYYDHRELDPDRRRCTVGLRLYQALVEKDGRARRWNLGRLRALAREHGGTVQVCSSHDVTEFNRLAHRAFEEPVAPLAGLRSLELFSPPPRLA